MKSDEQQLVFELDAQVNQATPHSGENENSTKRQSDDDHSKPEQQIKESAPIGASKEWKAFYKSISEYSRR